MASTSESTIDVLIVGAGPSGHVLMAALWMARCGVQARIIDVQATKVFRGKADSVQVRTMEILASFGIVDHIVETGCPLHETTFWGEDGSGKIKRMMRVPEWSPELGRYHQTMIGQGYIERSMLDGMKRFNKLEVERGVKAVDINVDRSKADDPEAYPVTVTVCHLTEEEMVSGSDQRIVPQPGDFNYDSGDEPYRVRQRSGKEGTTEIIRAKYVIGTDGARSCIRKAIGADFDGEPRESVGGVLDCVAETDFPDVLTRAIIFKDQQALMTLPREKGLIRFGVQFGEIHDRSAVNVETILERTRRLIHPYKVEYKAYDWHGIFHSSQRRASKLSKDDRIFLAGDALHTHSPKAGIGMNFSVQDSYNLGWKIAHVVKGLARHSILRSYTEERGLICGQLVDYDRQFSSDFMDGESLDLQTVRDGFVKGLPFTSCTAIEYDDGILVAKNISKQRLAPGAVLGRRLPAKWVIGHGSGAPVDLETRMPSDGRYKLLIFAGDISDAKSFERVRKLGQALEQATFIKKAASRRIEPKDLLNALTIHTTSRHSVEVTDLPPFLIKRLSLGLMIDEVFADNPESSHLVTCDAYDGYGIDRGSGCLVLLRPDRHVMYIGELEDVNELDELMSGLVG